MDNMPLGKHDDSRHDIECVKCHHKHQMKDRATAKEDGITSYFCPKCGEESYYNLTTNKS